MAATMNTINALVTQAALELGLGRVANPFESTDPNIIQLLGLAEGVGDELVLSFPWLETRRTGTIVLDGLVSTFSLPDNYGRMIDQTGWNRSTDQMLCPLSEQQWAWVTATDAGLSLTAVFRPRTGALEFWPQPPPAATVKFEYQSRWWRFDENVTDLVDAFTTGEEPVVFDRLLFIRALKLAWKREKGFDTTTAQDDFDRSFALCTANNVSAAPILPVSPRGGVHLLDEHNLPETGYGL